MIFVNLVSAADIADLPIASACDDPAEHFLNAWCPRCEQVVDAVCPECGHTVEQSGAGSGGAVAAARAMDLIRQVLQLAQSARNSKFTIGCILIAMGHTYAEGVSMADYARAWGVRRATVSKQCHLVCAALGLPPSRYMKDEATCAKYRLSNRRPHA